MEKKFFTLFLISVLVLLLISICDCASNKNISGSKDVKKCDPPNSYYDNTTSQCYLVETRGPCPKYMMWSPEAENSQFGVCSCLIQRSCQPKLNRLIIRSKKDQLCYPIYDKGNCKEKEWFTPDKNWEGMCTPNPCSKVNISQDHIVDPFIYLNALKYLGLWYENADFVPDYVIETEPQGLPTEVEKPTWYLHEDKCYMTFTQGHCNRIEEIAVFKGTNPVPECWIFPIRFDTVDCAQAGAVMIVGGALNCPYGMRRHGADCVPADGLKFEE